MANFNELTIVGHVGQNAEMRFTPDTKAVTNFSVAVSEPRGEETLTQWFEITAWEKLAERCHKSVTKGMQVLVKGRIYLDKWTGDDNITRSRLSVTASNVIFLSPKSKT